MNSTVRGILAVVVGFVLACVVMLIVEGINGHVIYPGLGEQAKGVTDPEKIRAIMAAAPTGAFVVVLFGWILGSLVGGLTATWLGKRPPYGLAIVIGVLITLGAIANNMMLPPPAWFWVLGLIAPIPAACFGARFATKAAA